VGPAVTRNLVKRRLRHLLRDRVASLPPGSTLVVRALPAAAGTPYASLGEEIDRLLRLDPDLAAERMVTC
jgi:ribonuclease P protein component